MRSAKRLFLVLTLLCAPLAPADGETPSADLVTGSVGPLQVDFSLGCALGASAAGPVRVRVSPKSKPPLFTTFVVTVTDSTPTDIVTQDLVDRMCDALRALEGFEGDTPGSKEAHVKLELEYTGRCHGESVERESYYTLSFDLLCTDVSEIHAPSGTDPGPAGDGFTSDTVEMEVVQAFSPDGAGVAYERGLGKRGRHRLRLAAGIREESLTIPSSRPEGLGLFSSDRLGQSFSDPMRVETELEVIPVDVSYGYRLLPPDRPVVPTLYVGAGYAIADTEGPSVGDLLHPDLDALRGSDRDSITLNAGVTLRFNLGRGRSGRYVYVGARARWYERRDGEEADEELFVGFGVPLCNCGRR